jgi:glucose/arabinose dehydrogenase
MSSVSYAYNVPSPRPLANDTSTLRYDLSFSQIATKTSGAELIQNYGKNEIITIQRDSGILNLYRFQNKQIKFIKQFGVLNLSKAGGKFKNFKINNFIYEEGIIYSHVSIFKDGCNQVLIMQNKLEKLDNSERLFSSDCDPSKNELFGGGLVKFQNKLYASLGDTRFNWPDTKPLKTFFEPAKLIRDKTYWGKTLEIDLSTKKISIFSKGHRNPLGLFFAKSPKNKSVLLFGTEMGPEGGDELNLLKRNNDYGWPLVSYGRNYDIRNPSLNDPVKIFSQNHLSFTEPFFTWLPSMNPTEGLQIADSNKFPDWNGNLIISTLTGNLVRIIVDYDRNSVIGTEIINVGPRIRDMILSPRGTLIISTDDGKLIEINLK